MFAKKTIWYTEEPKKNDKGDYIKEAVFDKRVKRLKVGDEVPSDLTKNHSVAKRLKESNAVIDKMDSATMAQKEQQAQISAEKTKINEADKKAAAADPAAKPSQNKA